MISHVFFTVIALILLEKNEHISSSTCDPYCSSRKQALDLFGFLAVALSSAHGGELVVHSRVQWREVYISTLGLKSVWSLELERELRFNKSIMRKMKIMLM